MQDPATPTPAPGLVPIPEPPVVTKVSEPELAFKGKDGRRYVDPLPWCPLLGQAGVSPEDHAADPEHEFRSVTTWLNYLPKDRLVKWSANMAADCAVEDCWVIETLGPYLAQWWFATAGERFRDMAGERGNIVHDVAEDIGDARERDKLMRLAVDDLLAGRPIAPSLLKNARIGPYVRGLQRFWRDHAGIVPIWVEVTVFSRRHDYAGTLDLIAWVPGRGIVTLDWKGLAVDTPIPTPGGWQTMGDLRVGDQVFGADGKPCNVIGKSEVHHRPCYRVTFDDGTSIICDDQHLWEVIDSGRMGAKRDHSTARVIDATELARTQHRSAKGQARYAIKLARPLDLPVIDLPIDPYLLGVWLGDGTATAPTVTLNHRDAPGILDEFEAAGFSAHPNGPTAERGGSTTYYIAGGFRGLLRRTNQFGHRTIPDAYMRASIEQRTALLQGLMDTDGCFNRARTECIFTTVDKALAHQVFELVASLGERPYLWEGKRRGFGLTVTAYEVKFRPHIIAPFRHRPTDVLEAIAADEPPITRRRRAISSVEVIESVPTQCIEVDSPDSLYLAGEQMVPTHNSSKYLLAKFSFQLAAYQHADYGIVDSVRVPVPKASSAAVVHIGAGEPDPITGEYPGRYEVVEVDMRPELLDVIDACQTIARWEHPSRILSPWQPAAGIADGSTVERPKFRWLSATDLHAEATQGLDDPETLALCRPPRERVEAEWREWRSMFVTWAADRVKAIVEMSATDATAHQMATALGAWWQQEVGPMVVDTDEWFEQCSHKTNDIIGGLSLAEKKLALPFGPEHPGTFNRDELFAMFSDEQMEAVASGRIFWSDGKYIPVPKRRAAAAAPAGEGFVCARRGRSADPGDMGKDRDPKVRELEDRLIEQLASVPVDLMAQLDEWHRRAGVPNLRHRTASMSQLLAVQGKLAELVELRRKRTDRVMRAFRDRFPESTPELLPTVLRLCEAPALVDLMTDEHVDVFEQVMEACGNMHVLLDAEAPGHEPAFVSCTSADQLAERWGTKKDALTAARAAAARVGLKPPRSTTDAAKVPVLVALLLSERAAECLTSRGECDQVADAA